MKKLFFSVVALIFFWVKSYSQTPWQWGFGAGSTLYFGDLGNEQYVPFTGTHYGCSFSLRHDLQTRAYHVSANEPFAFVVRADWLRIGYDETRPLLFNARSGEELRNFRRGLNFRNDLLGINAQFTWTIYARKIFPLWQHRFALYFFIGPGIYYSDPRADLFRGSIDINNRYYFWDDALCVMHRKLRATEMWSLMMNIMKHTSVIGLLKDKVLHHNRAGRRSTAFFK